jgi:serine/threonine-protein kinase RsbW
MPSELPPAAPVESPRPMELWTVLPAAAESVRVARRMLTDWLGTLCWPDDESIDIVLAVNEALSNVVDHAYPPATPGQAHLYAWEAIDPGQRDRRIIAVVTDSGRWKPAAATDPGNNYRGRGLPMMAGCMDSVHIEPTPQGTTVIMTSRPTAVSADNVAALPPEAADAG